MPSPYNLQIVYECLACKVRERRIFCNLERPALEILEKIKFTSVYPKGAVLFVEGETPRGVFILCSGRVKLTVTSSEGKTLIVQIAETGEVLGLSSSILGQPYELSAETLEPCQINFIKREDFLRLMRGSEQASLRTAEALSDTYQCAQREIRALGLASSATERLAKLLLDWCEQNGEKGEKGIRLKVLLTHGEIAQMIGTTRETVTRLLSDLRRKRVLEIKGSTFLVLDRERLEAIVTT